MSYDWWNILRDDAAKRGPHAVHLVETLGEARAMKVFNARADRSYSNFLDGKPPEPAGPRNLYDALEFDLKKILELRPNRFHFPSEGKTYPGDE